MKNRYVHCLFDSGVLTIWKAHTWSRFRYHQYAQAKEFDVNAFVLVHPRYWFFIGPFDVAVW